MTAAVEVPAAFTPEAIALNPRALPLRDPLPLTARPRRVAVAFDPQGLAPPVLEALASLPTATLGPLVPAGVRPGELHPREVALECPLEELEDAAREHSAAHLLLDAQRALDVPPGAPRLMGVINVTPDSFSDGGRFLDPARAIEHGLALAEEGAEILDVGGESTRPGAEPVPLEVELERVLPVIEGLAGRTDAALSIDTRRAEAARAALDAGASMVNDVSAGRHDPDMLSLVAARGVDYVAMHILGDPASMQVDPRYADPVAEVARFLRQRAAACLKEGVAATRIVLDPGIGFGKRLHHNLALLRRLPELRSLGRPLCLGVSRKSFIGHLSGAEKQEDWEARERRDRPADRLGGTAAAVAACVLGGAEILRVHDVRPMAEAARVARALAVPEASPS